MAERTVKVRLQADIANYRKAMAEADKATARLATNVDRHGNKITGTGARIVRSAEVQREAWTTAGTSLTAFGLAGVAALGLSAKAAMDWESAWTGVLKTVEGSDVELNALEGALRDMALRLPASATEIAAVAEAAGQLGIKVNDVADFTEVMVNLGETTNLTADEAATALARISNIMGTAASDVDRMGATIVDLGNNAATTEAEIVGLATRLAAAGKQAGLSEADVFAFASTLTSVGVEAEAGGTALSKVFTAINDAVIDGGEKLDTFARIAGVSSADFRKAYETDAAGAIGSFVEGMGRLSASGQSTTQVFEDLELTDSRLKRAVLSTGSAAGLLGEQLEIANSAWEDNTALVAEAEKRYETTQAKMEIARNAINELGISIGEQLLPFLGDMATGVADAAAAFADLPDPLKKALTGFGGITTGIALLSGGMFLALPKIIEVRKAFQTLAVVAPRAATAVRVASAATGILGAGLAIASVAFAVFADRNSKAKERVRELTTTLDDATGAFTDLTRETVFNNLVNSGAVDAAKKLGIELDVLTDAALGNEDAIAAINAQEKEFATGRAETIAKTGQLTSEIHEQNAGWLTLNDAIGDQNGDLAEARSAWADKTAAMGEDAEATETSTVATEEATDALTDYNDALEKSLELLFEASGAVLDEREAVRNFQQAIDDATASLEENGHTLNNNTEKGRANQAALDDIAQSTLDWVDAGATAGVTQEELAARMDAGRQAFIDSATDMGMSEEAAEDLANELNLIPDSVRTSVDVDTSRAAQKLAAIRAALAMPNVVITADARSGGGYYANRANGGSVFGPGTSTSDSIPAWLSNGEHVLSAREVQGLGGHSAVEAIRAAARVGFANGGPVAMPSPAPAQSMSSVVTRGGDTFYVNEASSPMATARAVSRIQQFERV